MERGRGDVAMINGSDKRLVGFGGVSGSKMVVVFGYNGGGGGGGETCRVGEQRCPATLKKE